MIYRYYYNRQILAFLIIPKHSVLIFCFNHLLWIKNSQHFSDKFSAMLPVCLSPCSCALQDVSPESKDLLPAFLAATDSSDFWRITKKAWTLARPKEFCPALRGKALRARIPNLWFRSDALGMIFIAFNCFVLIDKTHWKQAKKWD